MSSTVNPSCFVVQPFDGGKYDRRYEDVFKPAIEAAGYHPYRVDEDAAASIPIENIVDGIRASAMCFVEISENNPNVWFELGLAIAYNKHLCLVCSEQREGRFPFDIQHHKIIRYRTDSKSDFEGLHEKIVERLQAVTKLRNDFVEIEANTQQGKVFSDEITPRAAICLSICSNKTSGLDDWTSHWLVSNGMEGQGYNGTGTQLALRELMRNDLLKHTELQDEDSSLYSAYQVTEAGWSWIEKNLDKVSLQAKKPPKKNRFNEVDEIPF